MTIKTEQFELASSQETEQIKSACLRLLTRREHSKKEIRDKLTIKGFDQSRVTEVIDDLSSRNWQNDARYAENYARFRSRKGFGPIRIVYELRQQGIDTEAAESALTSVTNDWAAILEETYFKKYPDPKPFDVNERGKRLRFLLQRGFSNSMINALLNRQSKKLT